MLQASAPSIHKLPASVTDTLKNTISVLELKVDSLHKIANRAEISKDFFSDVNASILTSFASYTTLQITLFSLLIGIAGYLSWRWLTNKLEKIEAEGKIYTDKEIKLLSEKFVIEKDLLREELLSLTYDVQRSMYFHTMDNEDKSASFQWSLSAFCTLHQFNPNDRVALRFWAENTIEMLSGLNVGDLNQVKDNDRLDEYIGIVAKLDDEEFIEIFKNFK